VAQLFLSPDLLLYPVRRTRSSSQTPEAHHSYNIAVHHGVQFTDRPFSALAKTPGEGQEENS
jgi:hypothetical protein